MAAFHKTNVKVNRIRMVGMNTTNWQWSNDGNCPTAKVRFFWRSRMHLPRLSAAPSDLCLDYIRHWSAQNPGRQPRKTAAQWHITIYPSCIISKTAAADKRKVQDKRQKINFALKECIPKGVALPPLLICSYLECQSGKKKAHVCKVWLRSIATDTCLNE